MAHIEFAIVKRLHSPFRNLWQVFVMAGLALLMTACDAPEQEGNSQPAISDYPVSPTQTRTLAFDPSAVFSIWVQSAQDCYGSAVLSYLEFDAKTQEFLATPSQIRLNQLQDTWRSAHQHFASCRIFQQPVASDRSRLNQLLGELDAWPIMGGYLDAVPDYPDTGLINDGAMALTPTTLVEQHQLTDLTEVTLGFHAVEFLLWGADRKRSYTDYLAYAPEISDQGFDINRENRRRAVLRDVVAMILMRTQELQARWSDQGTVANLASQSSERQLAFVLRSFRTFLSQLTQHYFSPSARGDLFLIDESPLSQSTQEDVLASLYQFQTLLVSLVDQFRLQSVGKEADLAALDQALTALIASIDPLPPLDETQSAAWFDAQDSIDQQAMAISGALSRLASELGLTL